MKLLDLLLCAYPFTCSIEAVRNPRIATLKHWLTFWIISALSVAASWLIDNFLWWLPLIGIFDTLKILIIVASYRENFADNMRSLFIQPLWRRSKKYIPKYSAYLLDTIQLNMPSSIPYQRELNKYINIFKVIIIPSDNEDLAHDTDIIHLNLPKKNS